MSDQFFWVFFWLVVSTQKDSPCNLPLKFLAGIPSTKPLEPFLRSQLWDGQSGDFHWANAFSSGGMDLSPFSRQACGGKLSLGVVNLCWSGLVWVQDASYVFSLLLMCLNIYISHTVSVIYLLYIMTYLLCICMNYLSNCWFALIYSSCWWVWVFMSVDWFLTIDPWLMEWHIVVEYLKTVCSVYFVVRAFRSLCMN